MNFILYRGFHTMKATVVVKQRRLHQLTAVVKARGGQRGAPKAPKKLLKKHESGSRQVEFETAKEDESQWAVGACVNGDKG